MSFVFDTVKPKGRQVKKRRSPRDGGGEGEGEADRKAKRNRERYTPAAKVETRRNTVWTVVERRRREGGEKGKEMK